MALGDLKTTFSSLTIVTILPSLTSIRALNVAKKGYPEMWGISMSPSMCNITKLIGSMNLSILTKTSSITLLAYLIDQLASCMVILVGFGSHNLNFLPVGFGSPDPNFLKIL